MLSVSIYFFFYSAVHVTVQNHLLAEQLDMNMQRVTPGHKKDGILLLNPFLGDTSHCKSL